MVVDQAIPAAVLAVRQAESSPANAPPTSLLISPSCRPSGVFLNVPAIPARSVCAMAELKDRLRSDLTEAMKTQDKLRTATLRLLLAAIQTEEVSGKQRGIFPTRTC